MSKTMKEWDETFAAADSDTLEKTIEAISNLKKFESLWKEYSWTGLGILQISMENELRRRNQNAQKDLVDPKSLKPIASIRNAARAYCKNCGIKLSEL